MNKTNTIQIKSSNSLYILLLFLFSPIIAVFISVINYKATWAKNIVWLFCSYYGYTFVIGNKGSDVNRYKSIFEKHYNIN